MRNYQDGYYNLCRNLQDRASRKQQAEKIAFILREFTDLSFNSLVALDIGCADGTITSYLSSKFNKIYGVEYDRIALKHIDHSSNAQTSFLRGDAMHLPFRDDAFDVVICAQVYEHVPDDRLLVNEITRILKSGGLVFFSGPNLLFPIEPHYRLPFLHWLPGKIANFYLRLVRRGDRYYEKSRTLWGLRRLFRSFQILDVSVDVFNWKLKAKSGLLSKLILIIPSSLLKILTPIFPNYNWILTKESEPLP